MSSNPIFGPLLSQLEANPGTAQTISAPISQVLQSVHTNSSLNQIRGTGVNNATSSGIPKQVTNVRVTVSAGSTGITSTVNVTFQRDPTDKAYSSTAIWVKGYQGNHNAVNVATSAESPATFVLNNTGENLSIIAQATGNSGNAPLASSPTTGASLPKSTSGGFGSTTTTSTVITFETNGTLNSSQTLQNLKNTDGSIALTDGGGGNISISGASFGITSPGWLGNWEGTPMLMDPAANGDFNNNSANLPMVWLFRLPFPFIFNKLTLRQSNVTAGGATVSMGVYSVAGNRLVHWDNINYAGGFGTQTFGATGGAVTLAPGYYYHCCAVSTANSQQTAGGIKFSGSGENTKPWNARTVVRTGSAANSMSAGVLPLTLGTLTAGFALGTNDLPLWIVEPV